MNDYSPSESSPPKRHVLRTVLLIVGALILVLVLRSCLIANFGEFSDYDIQKHPEKYPAFNYALVALHPDQYENAVGMVSGSFVGFIPGPPDSPYTLLQVAEDVIGENHFAVWIVYGLLTDDEKRTLSEGMDIVAYGHCAGLVPVQRLGSVEDRSGLLFENIKFGDWIRP